MRRKNHSHGLGTVYPAAERTWVNLAWFGDVILSFVYGALGATGLSLLTGLIASATFYLLLQISRPGLPTWWGSVCAALALLAPGTISGYFSGILFSPANTNQL